MDSEKFSSKLLPFKCQKMFYLKHQCYLSSLSTVFLRNRNAFGIFNISFHVRTSDDLNAGCVHIHQICFGMTKFC